MALPNSRFAEMLRNNKNRRSGAGNWDLGGEAATALSLAPFKAATDNIYSDDYSQVILPFCQLNFCAFLTVELTLAIEFIEFGHKPTKLLGIRRYLSSNDGG